MLERVQAVFREVFVDDTLLIDDSTDAGDIRGWDSLNHINLIVAIEDEFDVALTAEEAAGVANVGGLMELLAAKSN